MSTSMNFPVDASQADLIKVLIQDQALISQIGLMLILWSGALCD
jgi:hypothetical protein